jgi:DNA topoisomerase-1
MQYCFDIQNPRDIHIDSLRLKNHVKNIYKEYFDVENDDELPFVIIHAKNDNNVCVLMTSRAKKNIELVESINHYMSPDDLIIDGVTLSNPYVFEVKVCNWWDTEKKSKCDNRWTSMIHQGPYFKHIEEPYEHLGAYLTYGRYKYYLSPSEEKIAGFYAKRLISERGGNVTEIHTENPVFNNNYFTDFYKYLTDEHQKVFLDLDQIGWENLIGLIESAKPGTISKDVKRHKKVEAEERKREYGFAILDGLREKVGNFIVEPASIFMGRGGHPSMGKIKREIMPEDVTINTGVNDLVPTPPRGHNWGKVVHDHKAEWLAKWKDTISGDTKYVRFSAEGKFKGECDLDKYEKARKLNLHIETVRNSYMNDITSNSEVNRQLGTVLYLIDHFGIRVGGEKGDDVADTVGASTLRVGHVEVKDTYVVFDFLGKDSIRFYKELDVPLSIVENFKDFLSGKSDSTDVFDKINAKTINEYLKKFDKTFTAKVFRTRLASTNMFEALQDVYVDPEWTKQEIKAQFNKANIIVAEILNHTRNVSKKAQEGINKLKNKLEELEDKYDTIRRTGKSTTAVEKSIRTAQLKIEDKSDTMGVAMTTSLTNYIDPRIVMSWCGEQGVDPGAIYTATLLKKFTWAVETAEPNWDYISSPLVGSSVLEPATASCSLVSTSRYSAKRATEGKTVPSYDSSKNMYVDDYTSYSFVIRGNTIPFKDRIKEIGGKYNRNLEGGPGWLFPVVRRAELEQWVSKMLSSSISLSQNTNMGARRYVPKSTIIQKGAMPGTLTEWRYLLKICRNPNENVKKLANISQETLKYLSSLSQYGIDMGSEVKANKYITKYFKQAYK